jgi:hypothetical protein
VRAAGEDRPGTVHPAGRQKVYAIAATAAVVVIGIIAAIAGGGGPVPKPAPDVDRFRLADVTGKHAAEGATILDDASLKIETNEAKGSKAKAGTIVAMDPRAGSLVEAGDTVTLSVAPGKKAPTTVKVPNVDGMRLEDAKAQLRKAGFVLKQTQYRVDRRDTGTVIKTAPAAGERVEKGSKVTVYAAKKPKPTPRPAAPSTTTARPNHAPQAYHQSENLNPAGATWWIMLDGPSVRDPDGDSWKIYSVGPANVGTVTIQPCQGDPTHGCFYYVGKYDYAYKDAFSYRVIDSRGAWSNAATISLCVRCND